ncbi:hypothetical protein J2W42_004781 [Rhizobium tibeticum]|uniref:hypothetical protein n=1 Tax=Rhizobium tibeticum TaxID=501024 RepID=UPI0027808CE3|nr:hypothetical protein [Rhizobium tibeticum]MDP9811911.1 hypothetical protein [Rhizobium tibeticum]
MSKIAAWLARLGLDKYINAFLANEVAFDTLSDEYLRELGPPVGPRRTVLAAIAALVDDTRSPASPVSEGRNPRRGATQGALLAMMDGGDSAFARDGRRDRAAAYPVAMPCLLSRDLEGDAGYRINDRTLTFVLCSRRPNSRRS